MTQNADSSGDVQDLCPEVRRLRGILAEVCDVIREEWSMSYAREIGRRVAHDDSSGAQS